MEDQLGRIRSQRNSKLDNQQKPAIILEAVEETLKSQNAQLTPTAYFAALLTTLEQSSSADHTIITAILYVLNVVMQDVPASVLKSQYANTLALLLIIIEPHQDQAPLVRAAIGCLELLMIAQDRNIWSQPPAKRSLAFLLLTSIDSRPRVRKAGQDAIVKLMQNPPPPALTHPAAPSIAEFLIRTLGTGSKDSVQTILHVLALTKILAAMWPSSHLETLCSMLLKLPSFNNTFVTNAVFEVFEQLFAKSSYLFATDKVEQVLHAIMDLQPHSNDVQLMPTWLGVVEYGFSAYARSNREACSKALTKPYKSIFQNYQAEVGSIVKATTSCLVSLIKHCIDKSMISSALSDKNGKSPLSNILKTTEQGLDLRYQASWAHVFKCLEALYARLGEASAKLMGGALAVLGDMRQQPDFELRDQADQVFGAAAEAMGPEAFLKVLPLNLESSNAQQPGRAWLLPLLKTHIKSTSFAHFSNEFMPMSQRFHAKMIKCKNEGRGVEAKVYEALFEQIWALFPGYCTLPTDLASVFSSKIGQTLCNLLIREPQLRPTICQGLQLLVERNQSLLRSSMDDEDMKEHFKITRVDAENNMKLLASYSPNFLSTFFNMLTSTLPELRGYLSECMKTYLGITPSKKLSESFKNVEQVLQKSLVEMNTKLQDEKPKGMDVDKLTDDEPLAQVQNMLDLMIAMAPFLNSADAKKLIEAVLPLTGREDVSAVQKKSFRVLNTLSASSAGKQALTWQLANIEKAILASANDVSFSARRDRLGTLHLLVTLSPASDLHIIPAILSEAIICTKEVNERSREEAYSLLVDMGSKMKAGGKVINSKLGDSELPDAEANIQEFFLMVAAGLSGQTPHMISASITSLSRLLFEFHQDLTSELLEQLINTMDEFVNSANREIVKSALGFVKVAILSLPRQALLPHLDQIVPGVMHWSHEHKSHFKSKVRHIIERLIKKFGFNEIENRMPEDDKKLLTNIRKRKERAKRKKAGKDDEDDDVEGDGDDQPTTTKAKAPAMSAYDQALYGSESEIDDDDDDDVQPQQIGKKGKIAASKRGTNATWIKHDANGEEAPLDLLGRGVASRITSTDPNARRNREKSRTSQADTYKYSAEGKMIVEDEDAMDVDVKKKSNGNASASAGVGDYVQAIKSGDGFRHGQGNRIRFNKRGRDQEDIEMDELLGETTVQDKRRKAERKTIKLGEEFKAKRAGGDVKRKDQAEPHAYLQLSQFYKSKHGLKGAPKLSITGKGKQHKRK